MVLYLLYLSLARLLWNMSLFRPNVDFGRSWPVGCWHAEEAGPRPNLGDLARNVGRGIRESFIPLRNLPIILRCERFMGLQSISSGGIGVLSRRWVERIQDEREAGREEKWGNLETRKMTFSVGLVAVEMHPR